MWHAASAIPHAQSVPPAGVENINGYAAAAGRILLKYRSTATAGDMRAAEVAVGAERTVPLDGSRIRVMHAPGRRVADLLAAARRQPQIEYAEPDYVLRHAATPGDLSFGLQWGLRNTGQTVNGIAGTPGADIHATAAWDIAKGSPGVVIAEIDGGVDQSHVDLAANIWTAPKSFTVTISGRQITCPAGTQGAQAYEGTLSCRTGGPHDHATHIAGIAAAVGNNPYGVAGVNWRASLLSVTFMTDGQFGYTSDAVNAIEAIVQIKSDLAGTPEGNIRVISNSWGGAPFSQALSDEIDRAGAADILFVSAAMNNGASLDTNPSYPAALNRPTQLTVASSNSRDQLSGFSNYSPTRVHLAAPGENIYSTLPGGNYGYMTGTSMATPYVAGAAALILSRCPMDTASLKSLLMSTVDRLPAFAQTTASGGRLNVANALQTCASGQPGAPPGVRLLTPFDGTVYSQQETVSLYADASDTDGVVTRVDFYAGSTIVGSATSAPYTFNWTNVAAGSYVLKAVATDNDGLQSSSGTAQITVGASAGGGALPSPWTDRDIGAVGLSGSASYSNGRFSVSGAGAGIDAAAADGFHYVSQHLTGSGQIVAYLTGISTANASEKAGVMVRADAGESATHAFLDIRPDGTLEFLARETAGQPAVVLGTMTGHAPVWLRVAYNGVQVTASASFDGTTWTRVGSRPALLNSAPTLGGLAVTSHDVSEINTSIFERVGVIGGTAPSPPAADIVIYAADFGSTAIRGSWTASNDPSAAAGVELGTPDNGVANTNAPLASPVHFVEATFSADAGVPYTLWLRMNALGNSKYNDSLWVQFSDAQVSGASVYAIGSSSGLCVNLATDAGAASLNGWGWQNTCYWLSQSTTVTFASSGMHTIRLQIREDGAQFDQIVLSPSTYISNPPGPVGGDHTIVARPSGPPPPPPPPPPSGLPSPWSDQDVGAVGAAGSASEDSSGLFTVKGAGADIWGSADAFNFVYQPLSGDGHIVARVESLENTNTHAKAGVMLRSSLDASSAHVILDVQPDGSIEFMTRSASGGTTSWIAGTTHAVPVYLMLARTGSTVVGLVSSDGTNWTTVGDAATTLPATVNAGLVVSSHTTAQVMTATFDSLGVTTSSPPPPPPSSSGNVVIYASDVPAGALHGSWTTAADPASPGGVKLVTPNNGVANTSAASSAPTDYVDVPFQADAGVSYTLWLRLKALNNDKLNDSIWVQFSDATVSGGPVYEMNSTSGLLVNLATDSSASSLNNWGWANGAYWLSQAATVRFAASGSHTIRIQVREDGVQLDQIVLSSTTYLNSPPGGPTNDSTIVSK